MAFKHNKSKAYMIRYHICENHEYVESGLTKTEFEQRLEDFRAECANDCNISADSVKIEIFESLMFVSGLSTTKFNYGVDKPSDYNDGFEEQEEEEGCEDCGYFTCRC